MIKYREKMVGALRSGLRLEAHGMLDDIVDCFAENQELINDIKCLLPIARRLIEEHDLLVPAKEFMDILSKFLNSYADDLTFYFRKCNDPEAEMMSAISIFFLVTHKNLLQPVNNPGTAVLYTERKLTDERVAVIYKILNADDEKLTKFKIFLDNS